MDFDGKRAIESSNSRFLLKEWNTTYYINMFDCFVIFKSKSCVCVNVVFNVCVYAK